MPKVFAPISYDRIKLDSKFLWQIKAVQLESIFHDVSYVGFNDYRNAIINLTESEMNNDSYYGRKYYGWSIEDEDKKKDYVDGVMLYDYVTFQYMNYGEHVFYLMPKLCEGFLNNINEDKELEIDKWYVPYPTCFFRFPDDLICFDVGKGVNSQRVEVEGCYIEEVYDGKVKIDKRIGIRAILVDKKGEMLCSFENDFVNQKASYDFRGKKKYTENDLGILNSIYVLIDRVLSYIGYIMDHNNDVEQEATISDIEAEIREVQQKIDGVSVRKRKNGYKGNDGVNVVVIAEKIKRKHPVFQNTERCLTVTHDVIGHWRHLQSDCFTKQKGQKVWVKACKHGQSNPNRIVTVYQVGRR